MLTRMTFTAHIDRPDAFGIHTVTVRRDGHLLKRIGVVDGEPLMDAENLLRRDGWLPEGDLIFWWGAPDGNMFDGPWTARVRRS